MADRRSIFTASLFKAELPPDWKLVSAGYVLNGTEYGLNEPTASDGGTPIVGMKDISDGIVRLENLATINGDTESYRHLQLARGDILLNRTNSPDLVGKVGLVREDSNAVFASYLVRLKTNRSRVDAEYLNYWLNCETAQRAMKRLSTRGVSQANINPTEFKKHCPIPLPPIAEQRKIAELLRSWDRLIEGVSKLIELRKRQYLGLRAQLVDWSASDQSHLCDFLKPISRPVSRPNEPYRALSIRSHGKGSFERLVTAPDTVDMDTLYTAKAGDVIVNITFAWEGAVALVPPEHDGCLVSHRFPTFVPIAKKANARYLRHVLRMPRFTYLLGIVSPGGAGRNRVLNKSDFLDLKVPLPDHSEQTRIATILDNAEAAIAAETRYRDALTEQKRGLTQKLLTGAWRVKIDSKKEAAA